ERERIKAVVRERQRLCLALKQLDTSAGALAKSRARASEHGCALVDAHDRAVAALEELARHQAGAGGDVQHTVPRLGRQRIDERTSPARVLTEAERRREQVVAARQPRKQLQRL